MRDQIRVGDRLVHHVKLTLFVERNRDRLLVDIDAVALARGRSTDTPVVRRGAATMKMIKSTSMTSMNGVMLMSAIAP